MKMTFPKILFGGIVVFGLMVLMVVFMPDMMWKPELTIVAHEPNELEARGRELYWANGCTYCHTQYVREMDNAMGPISQGGDFNLDSPLLLGSERTGPNLSHIGRKRSEEWEIAHMISPRDYSPMSIMPSFEFLPREDLEALAAYLFTLGDRVSQPRMVPSPDAYAQASDQADTMVALCPDNPMGWRTWTEAGLQEGKELYVERCLTCHGCAGNGLGTYAGTLIVTPAGFSQEPFRSMPEDQWYWHVSEGVQGTVMPPWKEALDEEQRWNVVRYIRTVFSRPVMRDPDEGDPPAGYAGRTNPLPLDRDTLQQGKLIFTRECMVCHGDAGRGQGPYRQGLQPTPPDFGDGSYGTVDQPGFADADYFWRISEGVPWTAMPTWKLHYGEEDIWAVTHYVRALLTHTEEPPEIPDPEYDLPAVYADQHFPETVSFTRGKGVYAEHCAHCHGLALDGQGWDGAGLNPVPADLRDMAAEQTPPQAEGTYLARVTFGIYNSAMPAWGEFLPIDQRWDAVRYIMTAAIAGKPVTASVMEAGTIDARFATLSRDMWINNAGRTVDTDKGAAVYGTYCATCHGDAGDGQGPGTVDNASKGPAPFPDAMTDNYVFWRAGLGVPDSIMPGFTPLLTDEELWNVTAWIADGQYAATPDANATGAPAPEANATSADTDN